MSERRYEESENQAARLYVGNLHPSIDGESLKARFELHGQVIGTVVLKGFGFVQYLKDEDAKKAIIGENGADFRGKKLEVKAARKSNKMKEQQQQQHSAQQINEQDESYSQDGQWTDSSFQNPNKRSRMEQPGNMGRGSRGGMRGNRGTARGGYSQRYDPHHDESQPNWLNMPQMGGRGRGRGHDNTFPAYSQPSYSNAYMTAGETEPYSDVSSSTYYGIQGAQNNPSSHSNAIEHPDPMSRSMANSEKSNDVEIVCANRTITAYAETIESRLKNMGLQVDVLFPNPDIPLPKILSNITSRGVMYAVLITPMSKEHQSVTLNVLQGTQQEHRNMLVEDALNFISRNYERDSKKKANSDPPLPERHPQDIINVLDFFRDNRPLSVMEYDKLIKYLARRREQMLRTEYGDSVPAHLVTPPIGPALDPAIKAKQEEYQEKIVKIIRSKKDIFTRINDASSSTSVPPPAINSSLQKAIDSLIKTGPNLLSQINQQQQQQQRQVTSENKGNDVLNNYFSTLFKSGSSSNDNMFSAYGQ